MDLSPFARHLKKDLGDAAGQFLPVLVDFNGTPGFIHQSHAAMLHDAGLPKDVVCFHDNRMIIGLGANTASHVTEALSQITHQFVVKGVFKPSGENLRVAPEYVDGQWSVLKHTTPYSDVKILRYLGFPMDSTALIKRDAYNKSRFILSQRAEGKAKGQFDITVIGKHEAEDTGLVALFKETKGETGCYPILAPNHPDSLKYLGIVHTASIHDNCVFQRRIHVHIGGLDAEKQLTDEVAGYSSFTPDMLINPPEGIVLQPHVLPIIGYALAHELGNTSYIDLAHKPINTAAHGTISGAVKARFVPMPYDNK